MEAAVAPEMSPRPSVRPPFFLIFAVSSYVRESLLQIQPPLPLCLRSPGAGADFVMMGGMLAGHDQCTGQVIEKDGKKYKLFYGMSSDTAMKKYVGGVAEYR